MSKKPIVLCIMDGFGLRSEKHGNAILAANKPNLDYLFANYPNTILEASGEYVGLPDGQMGNSEVGHMNIGAGRIVYQSLSYINMKIKTGEFFKNEKFLKAINHVKENNSNLHIFGLMSNGGVHSSIEHIYALLKLAKMEGLKEVYVHAFMDGRDVDPQSGAGFIDELTKNMEEIGIGKLASIHGRYYAMDRDKNNNRVDVSYRVLTDLDGISFSDYHDYFKSQYQARVEKNLDASDEFSIPAFNENVKATIKDNDSIIFANFRPDRAIQISTIFTNPTFYEVPAKNADGSNKYAPYVPSKPVSNICFVCMMKYADSVKGEIAFALPALTNILGEVLAERNYTQLRIAETEKYAHVTFFFDGTKNFDGVERPELKNCDRILINSPKVATYDLKPEMSAYEVTDALEKALDEKEYDVVILNFANCDMVGHTAIMEAATKATEVVDECVGRVFKKVEEKGGVMIITADHGNADMCIDENGRPFTPHTKNPVPCVITKKGLNLIPQGKLGDLAPTILKLLGEVPPVEMDGNSIIID